MKNGSYFSTSRIRLLILAAGALLLFLALGVRLYFEQIRSQDQYRSRIDRQSIRKIRIPPLRGKILTSDLVVLADNIVSYDICFYFEEMRQRPSRKTVPYINEQVRKLEAILGRPSKAGESGVERHNKVRRGIPMTVFSDLTAEEVARVFDQMRDVPGIDVVPHGMRVYPQHSLAAAVVGYARPEDPSKAEDQDEYSYYLSDLVGKDGIERAFNTLPAMFNPEMKDILALRGTPGSSVVQVDSAGYVSDVLESDDIPHNGNNVILTIDSNAQKVAESLLSEAHVSGAMVLMEAKTGDILAMASSPGYDLSEFSPVLSQETFSRLQNDPERPLFNRATRGRYEPGSILKPLVLLAILNNGISPHEIINCNGATYIGKARIRCASWRRGGHGPVDAVRSLQFSCNDYFIEMGTRVGLEKIRDTLLAAGIGKAPELELPCSSGIAPSREYKQKVYKTSWNTYDTGLLSMGQGIISITPLQAAIYTAAIANGGQIFQPHLVREVTDPEGNVLASRQVRVMGHLPGSKENLEVVRKGMFEVVNSERGTGRSAESNALTLWGKTGTAQVGPAHNMYENSWFICFGETRDGRLLALATLAEKSSETGQKAAPLAGEFFVRYVGEHGGAVDIEEDIWN